MDSDCEAYRALHCRIVCFNAAIGVGWILTSRALCSAASAVVFQCRYRRGVDSDVQPSARSASSASFQCRYRRGVDSDTARFEATLHLLVSFNAAIGVGWILTLHARTSSALPSEFQCRYRRGVDSDAATSSRGGGDR